MHRAFSLASSKEDLEHVTRYFYTNPVTFKIHYTPIEKELDETKYRFTIDTAEDFMNADIVLSTLEQKGLEPTVENLLSIVRSKEILMASMSSKYCTIAKCNGELL